MTQSDLYRSPIKPWNAGRIIGPKAPFKPKHVWAIRQQLKVAGRVRDLALFNSAIDAKLRGCDLVKLRVSDVAPGGAVRQRSTVIQQKTGRPVPFEITDATRGALAAWIVVRVIGQMIGCSRAAAAPASTSASANTRGWYINGWI